MKHCASGAARIVIFGTHLLGLRRLCSGFVVAGPLVAAPKVAITTEGSQIVRRVGAQVAPRLNVIHLEQPRIATEHAPKAVACEYELAYGDAYGEAFAAALVGVPLANIWRVGAGCTPLALPAAPHSTPQVGHLILFAGNSGGMTDPIVMIPLEEIGARTLEFGEAVETACKA